MPRNGAGRVSGAGRWNRRLASAWGVPVAALSLALNAHALIVTEPVRTYSVSYTLDDLQAVPVGFEITVGDSAIQALTRVEVSFRLVGVTPGAGFASEMFVSLTRDFATTAVLLNGVGITPNDHLGQGYDGWEVTLRDDAANGDLHAASLVAGVLSGTWAPDGRSLATDTVRPLQLGGFNGETGNGVWRLNVADLELGGQMRLESWSLALTGDTQVPEAATGAAVVAVVGGALLSVWRRRGR